MDCVLWQGHIDRHGYGRVWAGGRMAQAHRWAYEQKYGPISSGLEIDHLCRNRACVNPDHLEVVTKYENWARGASLTRINASKTHCEHGHPFDVRNTYIRPNGRRDCRKCVVERQRRYQERKKAA